MIETKNIWVCEKCGEFISFQPSNNVKCNCGGEFVPQEWVSLKEIKDRFDVQIKLYDDLVNLEEDVLSNIDKRDFLIHLKDNFFPSPKKDKKV